jgi:signal transduction histidine kinase
MITEPVVVLTSALVVAVLTALYLQGRLVKKMRQSREAERRAQAAERLAELGSMTSGLAHEIKNPLSTVVLNAQLIREELEEAGLAPEDSGRLQRRTKALEREAVRLREILEDFLRFAGRMNLDPSEQDVRAIVDQLVDFFHPQCVQSNVLLRSNLPEEPIMVDVDESLLKQALLNLLINALQSMEDAPSDKNREMMVQLEQDEQEVRIHIIDHGPGIEESRQDEIFHPYVSSKAGGSGLGLPTTRRIIEVHGGRIELHSKVGAGSDFVVHLPRPTVEDET